MKLRPAILPRFFHRIRFSSGMPEQDNRRLKQMMETRSTSPMVSTDLAKNFRAGHGLIVASWNRWDGSCAKVHAIGVVVGKRSSSGPEVSWVKVERELRRSDRPGKELWDNPTVSLDPTVVGDFQLVELFEEHKAELFATITQEKVNGM